MPTTIERPRKDEMRAFRCTLCGRTGEPLVRVGPKREFDWATFILLLVGVAGIGGVVYLLGYWIGIFGLRERKYICGSCRNAGHLVPLPGNAVSRDPNVVVLKRLAKFLAIYGVLILAGFIAWWGWQSYARNRTATVREVFLHGANYLHGPEVYMNDGTVWVLSDDADDVRMIPGDKVRYEKVTDIPLTPSYCNLYDVTTGYRSVAALRISAPFEHTSCPAK